MLTTNMEIFGVAVPVMNKILLIEYKKLIARDTDIQDLVELGG
jgi:hypothetical protein